MSNAFIYLLIFASVVLLIYYVVVIYLDMMRDKKDSEGNEIFIPGGDDGVNIEKKTVNEEGVIVGNIDDTGNVSDPAVFTPSGFYSSSQPEPQSEEVREEEHDDYANESHEQEQPSSEDNDEVAPVENDNISEQNGNDESGESEYDNNEEVTEEDKEREYWKDPFSFELSESSEQSEAENAESESSQYDVANVYDESNVNFEKDQTECNEINDSLETTEKYSPGEMDIEAFAKSVMEENTPKDIADNFMERM